MTAALDRATAALGNANVKAFLHVIREGESSHGDDAYRIINGGTYFNAPPWKHPYAGQSAPPGKAAGAYQYIPHTWDGCSLALGLGQDFSPVSQDLGAVYLIDGRGALAAVQAGDLVLACSKLAQEWVSLPGLGLARAQRVFTEYGGTFDAAPATPPQQPEEPMPLLLTSLLPMVLNLFAPKVAATITKATGNPAAADMLGPFLQSLFDMIGQKTGVVPTGQSVTTDAQAVAAVAELQKLKTTNAALVQQIEDHALDYLDKLAPLFDKLAASDAAENAAAIARMNAAAERAMKDRWDMTKTVVWFAAVTATVICFALLGAIIFQATTGDKKIDTALVGLGGPILTAAILCWREIFTYRFDGTPANNTTAAINAQIVAATENRGAR